MRNTLKISIFIAVFAVSLLSAKNSFGQEQQNQEAEKINISMKNVSLDKIFVVLNAQTGWTFVYDIDQMRKIGGVTLEKQNATLNDVLKTCLTSTPYTFDLDKKNRRAIISQKKASIHQGVGKVSGVVINEAKYDTLFNKVIVKTLTNATVTLTHKESGKEFKMYTPITGTFFFNKVPSGAISLKVTYVGKEDYEQELNIDDRANMYLYIQMQDRSYDISKLVVKGGIPLLEMKGDTIQINSKILHTIEGERAKDLLLQVPGIKISESGAITAFGEPVHRTYLNKQLFFGNSATDAFKYLPAKEVADMQVYDETKVRYNIQGKAETYQERVINIRSKTEIKNLFNGQADIGLGKLFKESIIGDDIRYRGNIGFSNYNTNNHIGIHLNVNNTNDSGMDPVSSYIKSHDGGTYKKFTDIRIDGYKNIIDENKKQTYFSYTYDFKRNKETIKSGYELDYYPTQFFNLRKLIQDNYSEKESNQHHVVLRFMTGHFSWDNISDISKVIDDNTTIQEQNTNNNITISKLEEHRIDKHLSFNNTFRLHYFDINSLVEYMPGKRFRIDSSSTEQISNSIRSKPNGLIINTRISTDVTRFYMLNIKDTLHPRPTYLLNIYMDNLSINHKRNKSKEIRYNETTLQNQIIDNANSFDYTNNLFEISYPMVIKAQYKNSAIPSSIKVDWKFITQMDNCKVPVSNKSSYNFFVPSVSIQGDYTFKKASNSSANPFENFNGLKIPKGISFDLYNPFMKKGLSYFYNLSQSIPSLEQLRERVDDKNPIWLVAGNPDLKPTITHNLKVALLWDKWTFTASANLFQNQIVQKQEFFDKETPLQGYNGYIIPANSTLSTYENINGCNDMALGVAFDKSSKKMRNTDFGFGLNAHYRHNYSYIQSMLTDKNNFSTDINLKATSFTKKFRVICNASAEYGKNFGKGNSNNDIEYIKQAVDLTIKYTLKDLVYAAGYLNVSNWNPIKSNSLKRTTTNVCNFELGTYVYKKYFEISTSVYDIFNSKSAFSSFVGADYTKNSWSPTFGRYWMFNIRLMIDRIQRGKQLH